MTRDELQKHIELYRNTEDIVFELDEKYGINIWNSKNPNIYNSYNLLIHNLLVEIFGEDNTELIESYIFEETNLTFEQLCEILKI
jgi:hypothetical protein